jgi:hypothetical protein
MLVGMGLLLLSGVCGLCASRPDDPPPADAIGPIEGDSIFVQGPMNVETANGQVKTILRSGSDVLVKAGQAHIDLVEGGSIAICGPAHFSILKSGSALTIALDNGIIHAHIDSNVTIDVYTAQIQAHPISIGGATQDVLVGLNPSGAMCFRATQGAVRIEQQFTGQSILIPQDGDVSLTNGQLETLQSSPGQCACEFRTVAKNPVTAVEVSRLASTEELKQKDAVTMPEAPQTSSAEEPVYQVIMPPLRYNAGAKVQQEYDPKLIVLVRKARVRPALIFRGRVEGETVVAQAVPPPPAPAVQKQQAPKKPADDSTWNRVRSFFHKLWSPSS